MRLLLKPKELTGCTVRLQAMAESMGAGGITVASSSDARVISKLPTVALKRRDTVAAGAAPAAPEPQVLKNKRRALINKGPKAFKKADAPASFKKLAAAAAAECVLTEVAALCSPACLRRSARKQLPLRTDTRDSCRSRCANYTNKQERRSKPALAQRQRQAAGPPHASPHSSVFIAHRASARAQLNAGLPRRALTALCDLHSH